MLPMKTESLIQRPKAVKQTPDDCLQHIWSVGYIFQSTAAAGSRRISAANELGICAGCCCALGPINVLVLKFSNCVLR
jgi:hypothetical protein